VTKFLIDADMAIYAMAGLRSRLNDRLAACYPGDVAISAISFAEIAVGTFVGKPPTPEVLDAFTRVIPIMAFDEGAARAYAGLPFERARFDRLLAAHALSLGAAIVTNNDADFSDVPGLRLENWTL
jgi:tRNA(fMet)-specific endonuclease VapC